MRARQLRTVDRESADDRLTSATEKTTPALSEYVQYHRVSRWQARTSATEKRQTEHCPCFQLCQKKNLFFYRTVEAGRRSFACDKQCTVPPEICHR